MNENSILVILSGWMKKDFANRKLSAAHSLVKAALANNLYVSDLQQHVMMLSVLRISTASYHVRKERKAG
jgi:hypothetical protein